MLLPSALNLPFVEEHYAAWAKDPTSVPADWAAWFAADAPVEPVVPRVPAAPVLPAASVVPVALAAPQPAERLRQWSVLADLGDADVLALEHALDAEGPLTQRLMQSVTQRLGDLSARQERVDLLIRVYRVRGHVVAQLDPLGSSPTTHPELELARFGLGEADLDQAFSARTLHGAPVMTLRAILQKLRATYCQAIGVQYMHIDDPDVRQWLQTRMETTENRCDLSPEEQVRIFSKLTDAEVFEAFLQKKFVGAKRFSLEGGESLIPLLDLALEEAAAHGVEDVVIGMAHRGRLNVLANIVGKSPALIFAEFADKDPDLHIGRGDVKYHLGATGRRTARNGRALEVRLCFNPSHLEFVGPVVAGRVRARQDRLRDTARRRVLPIVIHGDAAMAGQGVVQELLNMSQLPGYGVGGTVHVVVNNQVGFTTPPESGRSSHYATDVAKLLQIPIFHVNGEHPEAVTQGIRLALEFRERFGRDVVIDMYCYRRHGHNEGDDPTFTQPVMYKAIRSRKSVVDGYFDSLEALGSFTRADADRIALGSQHRLDTELAEARTAPPPVSPPVPPGMAWSRYVGGRDRAVAEVPTGIPGPRLQELAARLALWPAGFTPHPKLVRLLAQRREMGDGVRPVDWGAAEALAFASLVGDGHSVRLSGQDSGRGTFSHRHAVLHDQETGATYVPLQHVAAGQAPFDVWDSPLSEAAVLGFDYGYSLDCPDGLTLWEAQFGDFSNCAQVIIDQFLSSCEDKWNRLTGLTLLLPHGFEGQGPEHSSARLERFLNIAAEDNLQVCNVTTPAQWFHLLRRQVLRPIRKPLVVMTPKSLLRHPECVSAAADLVEGSFQRVLADPTVAPRAARKVLICSGKVYFDLVAARRTEGTEGVAIVRLEQFYPLSDVELRMALEPYADSVPVAWVQEEPLNMGAWGFLRLRFGERLFDRWAWHVVARPESASPATGSPAAHRIEQDLLVAKALSVDPTTTG
ncbi:MAG: 2-oxoglutarate dehydrogenase E1 component [Myxococcales bacterium]|nr:2-oxoglutarate dehydrogenase E1 component [Myxococcales bacterium]